MTTKPTFSHTHTQPTASNQWTVVHGLGCQPSVAVQVLYEGKMQTMIPNSINYTDDNTVVIGFSTAYSGTARLF